MKKADLDRNIEARFAMKTDEQVLKEWEALPGCVTTVKDAQDVSFYMVEIKRRWPKAYNAWIFATDSIHDIRYYVEASKGD